ncbi:unnamed protein product, partial [Owenia fusiformis]
DSKDEKLRKLQAHTQMVRMLIDDSENLFILKGKHAQLQHDKAALEKKNEELWRNNESLQREVEGFVKMREEVLPLVNAMGIMKPVGTGAPRGPGPQQMQPGPPPMQAGPPQQMMARPPPPQGAPTQRRPSQPGPPGPPRR